MFSTVPLLKVGVLIVVFLNLVFAGSASNNNHLLRVAIHVKGDSW